MALRRNVKEGILHPFKGKVYHLAPVPVLRTVLDRDDLNDFHADLIATARRAYREKILEVPDERHIEDMGSVPEFPGESWREIHKPAVGVWHRVPTNNFLDLEEPCVAELRSILEQHHRTVIEAVDEEEYVGTRLLESWIQFYKNGDQKVLHNHQRYDYPFYEDMWVGAYYLTDGEPDYDKKYSGLFSFNVRGESYYIRPRPGLLLLWPYDILHEVQPFYGASERIVINFHLRNAP